MKLPKTSVALFLAFLSLYPIALPEAADARTARTCPSVRVDGKNVQFGVSNVSCARGAKVVAQYWRKWQNSSRTHA